MAKILLIDDEEIIRERMTGLLELDDYETFSAEDGSTGLEIFEKEKPEIALVDIKMPGMDGIEVLKRIKEKAKETEVIIITGHGGVDTAIQAIREGAFSYVQKPIEYDELAIEIKRALERQEIKKRLDEHVDNLERANAELESLYQQLAREHEIATQVFANVTRHDDIESRYMKSLLSPMDIVGGDLFLTATGQSGSQYVFLGDFTGHGLSAAIGAIPVSDIFYTMAGKGHSIEKIVTETNLKLKNVLPTGLFLCACFVELDYTRGTLTVWNGGLPDALIIGREGGIKRRLPSLHLPLGVVSTEKLDTSVNVVELAQGDLIYIYTDGVIEASNKDGEMFGQQRLEEHFIHIQSPENLFDEIFGSLSHFRSGAVQQDDIAILEIRYDLGAVSRFDGKTVSEPKEVSTGWRLALELGPESLRTEEVLPHLMEMLIGAHRGLGDHKENIYLMVSELFSNALDWGVLGLDSGMKKDPEGFEEYYAARERGLAALDDGRIKIDLELFEQDKGGKLVVRVEDSGPGFDYQKAMSKPADNTSLGGRGIRLVRSFCKEFVYQGRGNRVEAVYVWP
jgi:serine phosphatase RsbU (regulator of sigma subunit)